MSGYTIAHVDNLDDLASILGVSAGAATSALQIAGNADLVVYIKLKSSDAAGVAYNELIDVFTEL